MSEPTTRYTREDECLLPDGHEGHCEFPVRGPRRGPPEPSAAAIEAALAKVDFGRPVSPMHLDSMEDSVVEALRAAYAVDARPSVTVEQLAAWIREVDGHHMLGAGELAEALHAHLVPPEASCSDKKRYLVTVEISVEAEDADAAAELAFTRRWLDGADVTSVEEE